MARRLAYGVAGFALLLGVLWLLPWLSGAAASSGPAGLRGRIRLQGRANYGGVMVRVAGQAIATSPDGSFMFPSLPIGEYSILAKKPGFVGAQMANVGVAAGQVGILPEILLRAGDVDGDDDIDLLDLVTMGREFGSVPAPKSASDLNEDNQINIFDLVTLAGNYGLQGPMDWDDIALPTPTPSPTPTATATPLASPTPTQTPSPTPTPVCVSAEEAANYVMLDMCVRYTVNKVLRSNDELYLYAVRPERGEEVLFYTLIRADYWGCWPPPIEGYFMGKEIQVQGKIITSRAYPHIKLSDCRWLYVP